MLGGLELIARNRIEAALERGELSGLPGEGKRQCFDDERLIPEEQRMLYRILKNSGCVPEAVELRRRIARLEAELRAKDSSDRRDLARLAALRTRLEARG